MNYGACARPEGARSFDDGGNSTGVWGAGGAPPGGLLAQGGFGAGETRHFQVFYRELDGAVCATGQNTTNAIQVQVVP